MTVNTLESIAEFDTNGVTTNFPFFFKFLANEDLVVTYVDPADVSSTLTLGIQYTVVGAGDEDGGSVNTPAPLAGPGRLIVSREMQAFQPTSLRNQGKFLAETHEDVFDKLTMLVQQGFGLLGRALLRPFGKNYFDAENRNISNLKDPVIDQDAATKKWSQVYIGSIISAVQGNINNANNVFYLPPSGVPKVVQDMARYGADQGDAMIAVQQPFTDAAPQTQHDKNAQTIHINDINPMPANTWLSRAIDATPEGWTLQLGLGPYLGKFNKTRNNIRIVGVGRPRVFSGMTSMIPVSGTIVQGTVRITGSGVTTERFGVDCGQAVCDALNGGAAMDALVLNDVARQPLKDCTVRDMAGLLATPNAAAHNFLLEGCEDSFFENLHSYNGQWGTVMKTKRSHAVGVFSFGCREGGFVMKSDSGATGTPCLDSTATGIYIDSFGNTCETGILIYGSTSTLANCTVTDYLVKGCNSSVKIVCDTRAVNTNLLVNVQMSNGVCDGPAQLGLNTFGAIRGVQISNMIVRNSASNKSIQVEANCLGIHLVNVTGNAPGAALSDNIYLAGVYTFENLQSIVSDDLSTPAGITAYIETQARSRIGSYVGTLYANGALVNTTFTNGWTTAFASTVNVKVIDGRAQLFGRAAVPATPWTGKAQICQMPAQIAPLTNKYFIALGYGSDNKAYPVTLRVGPGGGVFVDDIAIVAAFPAVIAFVALDGINWLLAE